MSPSKSNNSEPHWTKSPPQLFSVVTGFFPETSPKQTWATNPRPLLVCGTSVDEETGIYFCRVAYGTTQNLDKSHKNDLCIGNVSIMNEVGLAHPTRFVTHSGAQMVILPWISEFFQPWTGKPTPRIGLMPEDIQRHLSFMLSGMDDLPKF